MTPTIEHLNFFMAHPSGWLMLAGLAIFPRITLLFVGGPFAWLHWLGWVFTPHLLVAILATTRYWDTNPVLCIIAWFIAFAGTGGEGRVVQTQNRRRKTTAKPA